MVGSGRADAGGQLLQELEALSQALYRASSTRGERYTVSADFREAKMEEHLHHSHKKKSSSLWGWKPLRALSHLGQRRFSCTFVAYIHGIKLLPASLEGLRLQVRLRNKDSESRTVPSLVFRGAADVEEALRISCSVYGSPSPSGSMRYMPKNFVLSVVAPDAGELVLGKHRLDLSRILPQDGKPNSWHTSFKLSGKARGGILVITFGYEMEGDGTAVSTGSGGFQRLGAAGGVAYPDSSYGGDVSGLGALRSFNSLPNSPKIAAGSKLRPMMSSPAQSEPDFCASEYSIEIEQLNLDGDEDEDEDCDLSVNASLSSGVLAPGTPGRQEEQELELSMEQSSEATCSKEVDDDGEFNVIEQGVEDVCHRNTSFSSFRNDDEEEIGEFLHMLGPTSDGEETGGSSASDFSPRALLLRQFEHESLGGYGLDLSFEQDEAVHVSGLEHESAAGTAMFEEEPEDLSAFVDAAECELQKATQMMKSKARAKMLEDAEAEALMQEWGLNEKAFQSSPPKTSDWMEPDPSSAMVLLHQVPCLADGLGTMIPTRDGGCLRSMNPVHFQGGRNEGRLVLHVSKSVVVPTDMGSSVLDIFRSLAAGGAENMAVQVMDTMPLEDITGKTVHQIAREGQDAKSNRYSLEGVKSKPALGYGEAASGPLTRGSSVATGALQSGRPSTTTRYAARDEAYMSLDELAPVAMDKIEALAMQGLKIQADMAEEEAPYTVDPLWRNGKNRKLMMLEGGAAEDGGDDLMSMSISVEEWMRLDAGVFDEEADDKTMAILAAHSAAHSTSDIVLVANNEEGDGGNKQGKAGLLGDTLTLAMLVQLRDPLRNYEPVGAPMMALVQAERVMVPPKKQTMWRRVSLQGNGEDEVTADEKPQFKITGVHMAGLKATETPQDEKRGSKVWGTQKQQQSGSRWLLAHGMGKAAGSNSKHPLLKSKNAPGPSSGTSVAPSPSAAPPAAKSNKQTESLWSISSKLGGARSGSGSGSGSSTATRNPDVKLGSRLSFGKKKW